MTTTVSTTPAAPRSTVRPLVRSGLIADAAWNTRVLRVTNHLVAAAIVIPTSATRLPG